MADLRAGNLVPTRLTASDCAALYRELGGSYQSPKTIQIYAQQCHGNTAALPKDTWVETFFKWPLGIPLDGNGVSLVFHNSARLGKVERLIWVAAQARKIHSSACNDALWCIKYGAEGVKESRGANPLACRICLPSIRDVCPAYAAIADQEVVFNVAPSPSQFGVYTSSGENSTQHQRFLHCAGRSLGSDVTDTYSPDDQADAYASYPQPHHQGEILTVREFVRRY